MTLSGYLCPTCRKSLSYVQDRLRDLYCFHCRTAVVIVDEETIVFSGPDGNPGSVRASIGMITPTDVP